MKNSSMHAVTSRITFSGLCALMLVSCGLPGTDESVDTGSDFQVQRAGVCAGGVTALVPTMTSNTAPSGIVTSSGVYGAGYEAWQAFDATTYTSWLSNMDTSSVWIAYEFAGGAAKIVTSYEVRYANGSCCEERGPKNWTLEGWNGSSWVTVDTVTNQTGWYSNPNRTFTVDSPRAYAKYRMNVTADNYNGTYPITLVSIATVQLYGSDPTALVPTMTSNTAPSGIVTSSGVYGAGYEAWRAFDATTNTLWLSNMNTYSVWIAYEFAGGAAKSVTSYEVKYANGSCCEGRGPKNWTLEGWNGSSWVTVDTVTNQTGWYSNPNRTFTVDSPGAYAKYRMNVTADNYNGTYPITLVSIATLQLYGSDPTALVPTMTSNTAPSGIITSSGVYDAGYPAWQAFDATTNTSWLSNMDTSSVWIAYEFAGGAAKIGTSYEIRYANGSCCEERGPKNWTFEGWNGSSWVTVDTVTNQTGWYSNPNRTFTVDFPGCYTMYRLNVTADNYNRTYPITLVSIATLQFYGY